MKQIRLALAFVLLTSPAVVNGQTREEDEKYFNGLRQRRLFSLAESVCLKQLENPDLPVVDRARFSVELSRTLSEHALHVRTIEEQDDLFDRAREAVQKLLDGREPAMSPLLLRAQLQFVSARQVESIRLRLELTPFDDKLRATAIELSTRTIPALDQLQQDLRAELRKPVPKQDAGGLKPYQLRGAYRIARFRLASLILDQARLFAKGTPDRAQALLQAEEQFRGLAEGTPGEMVTWQSQLGLVTAIRLRGDTPAAGRLLKAMERDKPPQSVLDEIVAEQAELLIRDGHLTDAVQHIREYRKQRPALSGRLLWVQASALQQLSRVAASQGQKADAEEFLEHAATLVRLAQINPGGFWAARCRQLLTGARKTAQYGEAVAKIVRQAEARYSAGQLDQAIALYQEAFQECRKNDVDAAVELGYLLGSVLLQAQRNGEAFDQFRQVVELQPDGPRASDADFLAAFATGLQYRAQPTKANRERYTRALESHRQQFASSRTAYEAAWLLAQLEERRLQSTSALKLYLSIPITHARGPAARVATARCAEAILDRLRRLKQPASDWEDALLVRLLQYVSDVKPGEPLSADQGELFLRVARILMTVSEPDFDRADQLLVRIETLPVDSDDEAAEVAIRNEKTRNEASRWRVISLAGRGQVNEARYLLEKAAKAGPERLLALFDGLNRAAVSLPGDARRSLGDLQIRTLQLADVDPETLDAAAREQLLRSYAGAYEMAGNNSEAARHLSLLLDLKPEDTTLRRDVALLQTKSGRTDDLRAARKNWQQVEAGLKPGTVNWMDARVKHLRCLVRLGEKDECRKLLKFTKLLYRDAGSESQKRELVELEQQLAGEFPGVKGGR